MTFGKVARKGGLTSKTTISIFNLIIILATSVKILAAGGDLDWKLSEGFTAFPFVDNLVQRESKKPGLGSDPASQFGSQPGGVDASAVPATTYIVTNTSASLFIAISNANSNPGADTIVFNIPTSDPGYNPVRGVWTITITSGGLPTITDAVTIDGTTQPGFSGTPRIEINGANVAGRVALIGITAGGCTIRGLAINRMQGHGIKLATGGGNVVEANFVGTDAAGMADLGNRDSGIDIEGSSNNRIGGADNTKRNLISGNDQWGITVSGTSTGNKIQGNFIGTNRTGTAGIGNANGVLVVGTNNNTIGVDADGSGAGNTIADNTSLGVWISSGTGNRISRNSIFDNGGRGIVLGNGADIPNDNCDTDTGANNLQNYPVLTSATADASTTTIQGTLNSAPNSTYVVQFFSNASCDASGRGEGKTFLGEKVVTTDANCVFNFTGANAFTYPVPTASGQVITATAIDPAGNTSEFSQCRAVQSATCVPPTIEAQPQTGVVLIDTAATLTVTASGTSPFNYQWFRGDSGDTSQPIAGATSSSYTTPPLSGRDGDRIKYWVRVSNSCGSTNSSTAMKSLGTYSISLGVYPDPIDGTCGLTDTERHYTVFNVYNFIASVSLIASFCDGNLSECSQPISGSNITLSYRYRDGGSVFDPPVTFQPKQTDARGSVDYVFSTDRRGYYDFTAIVQDPLGRESRGAQNMVFCGGNSCPLESINVQDAPSIRKRAYDFRDNVLVKSERGKKYTHDYYQYAGEITKLMIFNPSLFARTVDALERYQPVVESMLSHERARAEKIRSGEMASDQAVVEPTVVTDRELDDVDELLNSFSAQASGQLRQTLDGLRSDIRDPEVQAEFGIQVRRGEKRPLPDDGAKPSALIGALSPFDFKSGLEFLNPFSASTPVAESAGGELAIQRDPVPAADTYGQIPLSFEANRGQVDKQVKYLSRGTGYTLSLMRNADFGLRIKKTADAQPISGSFSDSENPLSALRIPHSARSSQSSLLEMKLDGANLTPRIVGREELPGKSNYFIGNDARNWRADIPNYSRVEYKQVYKGVDLIYYGNQRQLEYDFRVAPGADPKKIGMNFTGADKIELDDHGDLLLHIGNEDVRMHAPVSYQEIDGVRHEIASRYVLRGGPKSEIQSPKSESATLDIGHSTLDSSEKSVGFEVDAYDPASPLVIDPVLVYSTYLGGSGDDEANSITVDAVGNAYIIGFTDSTNFPVAGAIQPAYGGNPQDVFVSKLNTAGTALVYSTYLGGSGQDNGSDIAVDAAGNAYITGYTGSTNFPTASAMQATRTGFYNAFVAKLNPTGSQLVYSTYYGGTVGEFGSAIAVDSSGNAYVGGVTSSPDMPKLNPIQSNYGGHLADAFVAKFNPAGSQIVYATYLGGNGNDGVNGIAIDTAGNAYISGVTFSTNFPTANPMQANFRGGAFDAFVSKINPSGTALVYSTYLGGTDDDRGYRIALDAASNVYIAGQTSSPNFPTAAALQPTFGGGSDAFITKLNPSGAITYSTFLGGSGLDGATGLAVNPAGNAYLTGYTSSTNFPLADPSQPLYNGGEFDAFVTKLNAGGTALAYSTYLGGSGNDSGFDIAVDPSGNGYVFGRTASTNFPTVGPIQPANGGGTSDLFITKLAATVGISGRVTTPSGLGLRNSTVVLTDSLGVRRTVTTSSFGFYQFDNVPTGATYVISIQSRSYRFASRTLQVNDNLTNVDFVGLE